jgi:protoporphyrinogen oxidase
MRVAIVGAGVAGLTAAHDLAKAGHTVVVYEAANNAGGLASGFRDARWEWPLERFYHHLFETDTAIRGLVAGIGYGDKLFFRRPVTAQWWNGRGYALDGVLPILRFAALPFHDRIRYGAVGFYLKYLLRDWRPLERTTATAWTRRWMGDTVYRIFMRSLLEGKFGPYAEEVNMAWLWARFKARSFKLGYFVGGFQGFVDALLAHVRHAGVVVALNTPIAALTPLPDGGWRISPAPGAAPAVIDAEEFDAVIVTGSPQLLTKLAPQLPLAYLGQLTRLRSMGAVVMTIALTHPLTDGLYWVNMPKEQFPFLALVEHTNFVEPEHYGGDHLIYCGDYLDPSHEYFRMTQGELLERFLPALKKVNPRFEPSWVRAAWLHREPYAQPIVTVDHSRNIPPLATPLPGLFWASMSQVYPWDRGTNFAVELGQRVAREVAEFGRVMVERGVAAGQAAGG